MVWVIYTAVAGTDDVRCQDEQKKREASPTGLAYEHNCIAAVAGKTSAPQFLESHWPAEVVLLVGCPATDLADELGVLDYLSHIFHVMVLGVFAQVSTVFAHTLSS